MAHYVPKHLTARKRRRRTGWGWLIVLLPALICLVACRAFTTRGPDPTPVAAVSPVGLSLPSPEGTETSAPTVTPAPTPTPPPTPTPTPTATPEPEEVKPLFLFLPEVPLEPDLQEAMQAACDEYNVPFALALAVAEVESSFSPDADNGLCIGLMQINSINFSWLNDLGIDPRTYEGNIRAGVLILGDHLESYGDWHKALMAYNCGATGARRLWEQGYTSSGYSRTVVDGAVKWQSVIDETEK